MSAAEKLLAEALALPIPERAKLLARIAESFVPEETESDSTLTRQGNCSAWDAWVAEGEQGPISDGEGAPELP
jgi:hypothetical protein